MKPFPAAVRVDHFTAGRPPKHPHAAARLDHLAFAAIAALGVCFGLGDIAQVTSLDAAVLTGIRGLLPLGIGLALLACVVGGRRPAFPRSLAVPGLVWLAVLVVSAALATSNRQEAFASLERPASGALLAWALYELSRSERSWALLIRAVALGGLGIAIVGLAEASGLPSVQDWLAQLHDGSIPIGDVPRIASTLSHPNEAAMLLELSVPLLVAWAWTASRSWRVPLALCALATLVAMVLTFSRAGIVAGLAALAVLAGVCLVRGERRPLVLLGVAVLAVPAALVCAAMTSQGLDHRLTAELAEPGHARAAILSRRAWNSGPPRGAWCGTIRCSGSAPTTSAGGSPATPACLPTISGVHAHDQYLEALADTGLVGLARPGLAAGAPDAGRRRRRADQCLAYRVALAGRPAGEPVRVAGARAAGRFRALLAGQRRLLVPGRPQPAPVPQPGALPGDRPQSPRSAASRQSGASPLLTNAATPARSASARCSGRPLSASNRQAGHAAWRRSTPIGFSPGSPQSSSTTLACVRSTSSIRPSAAAHSPTIATPDSFSRSSRSADRTWGSSSASSTFTVTPRPRDLAARAGVHPAARPGVLSRAGCDS